MKKNTDFPSVRASACGSIIVNFGVWEICCPFNDTTMITREGNDARMLVCYKTELADLAAAANTAYEEARRQ
jgi:hypothetical protein